MSKISSDLYIHNRPQETRNPSNVLGKDDFLRLLMAQLQNQDPMNPMEDREFIAQMASFSSLEQMTNLNKNMENFISTQNKQQALSMQQYLGTKITWQDAYYVEDELFVETKTGVVTSVAITNGMAYFIMDDGSDVSLDQMTNISHSNSSSQNNTTLLQASQLIGKKVSLVHDDVEYKNVMVNSVVSKDGKVYLLVNDPSLTDEKIPLDAITKIAQ